MDRLKHLRVVGLRCLTRKASPLDSGLSCSEIIAIITFLAKSIEHLGGRQSLKAGISDMCLSSFTNGVRGCQFRLKIPRCTGRKFPTPEPHEWTSLAPDGVEPSAAKMPNFC